MKNLTHLALAAVLIVSTTLASLGAAQADSRWRDLDDAFDRNGKTMLDGLHFTELRPAFTFTVEIPFSPKVQSNFAAAHHEQYADEVTAIRWLKSGGKFQDYPFWGSDEPGTYGYRFRTEGHSFDPNLEGRLNVRLEKSGTDAYVVTFRLTPSKGARTTILRMQYLKRGTRWVTIDLQANKNNGDEIDEIVAVVQGFSLGSIVTKRQGRPVGSHRLQ